MFSRAVFAVCAVAGLLACNGASKSNCASACEQTLATGPRIDVVPNGASIAAIETLVSHSTSGGTPVCSVGWSGAAMGGTMAQREPVCPAQTIDAGWAADACAQRYACPSPQDQLDGGYVCTQAWINLLADHCLVTVISTAGERQSFEAMRTGLVYRYSCHAGMGECIEIVQYPVYPLELTVTFAQPDAAAANDGRAVD